MPRPSKATSLGPYILLETIGHGSFGKYVDAGHWVCWGWRNAGMAGCVLPTIVLGVGGGWRGAVGTGCGFAARQPLPAVVRGPGLGRTAAGCGHCTWRAYGRQIQAVYRLLGPCGWRRRRMGASAGGDVGRAELPDPQLVRLRRRGDG